MNRRQAWLRLLGILVGAIARIESCLADEPRSKAWEAAIQRFEASDREQPPAEGGVVFVGSSSIRLWDLSKSFADLPVLNRGFGGSQLADSATYCQRIVVKYRPRVVVLYAGDNDIAFGKSPAQVADDLRAFVAGVREGLPEAHVIYLSIKPSLARWKLYGQMQETNRLCAKVMAADAHGQYLEVGQALLGEDGKPRPEMFVADGLHLSAAGYAVWAELLRPVLEELLSAEPAAAAVAP